MRKVFRNFGKWKYQHPVKKGQRLKKAARKRFNESYIVNTEYTSTGKLIPKSKPKISKFVKVENYNKKYHQPGLRGGETPIPCSPYLHPYTVNISQVSN